MVKQEIWALLTTHYAIRTLMSRAATGDDADPDRLSFTRALRIVRRQITSQADFSPDRLQLALADTFAELTERPNPPRRPRSYPRVLKRGGQQRFPRKQLDHGAAATPKIRRIDYTSVAKKGWCVAGL